MKDLKLEISNCLNFGVPSEKLIHLVAKSARCADQEEYLAILELVHDEDLASLVMVALPGWGKVGIDQLIKFSFDNNIKLKSRTRALEAAMCISRGVIPSSGDILWLSKFWDKCKKYDLPSNLSDYCLFSLRDRLFRAFSDDYEKSSFLLVLGAKSMMYHAQPEENRKGINFLLSLVLDNQLILNSNIINKLESVINSNPKKEEEIQKLLTEHPILLDPFVNELFSKQQLGSDFITDYVVKRTNNQYVVVEIENSTDKLFNKNGSFSSNLMEAISQVRDFQAWISDNLAYAQKKLPAIKYPDGLVVIGRSSSLNDMERKRLTEENHSRRGHIKIITYDELIETAKSVHRNLVQKPLVKTSKETKSI
ncbi:MAG: DUF4263 domain-containing protein [Candidatus Scalindua sp.]|jgi:hypothetical protein|nr:DUF4263 domain-containing protein [Candidatus Scalindua sp.]MBT6045364.1 DUF4263 domain-containing protein [Candidatus Scalindua sp.]MBT6231261.1 DUF4263 domain-containing protein [Candidatus Scalindua sp.]